MKAPTLLALLALATAPVALVALVAPVAFVVPAAAQVTTSPPPAGSPPAADDKTPSPQTPAAETPPPEPPAPPPAIDVMYVCPGGPDFSAHFSNNGELVTLKMSGQPDLEMPRQTTATGYFYTDGYYELRGRAREATLTAAGRSLRCHAAGRPGQPPRTFANADSTLTLFPDGTFRLREKRAGAAQPVLDLGQWSQEVDGGVRLVVRGSDATRRAFREVGVGKLIDDKGAELTLAATPDPIEGKFRLTGLYRDAQDGGLFTECYTDRTYAVAPGGAEPDLERAWVEATPSRETSVYAEVVGEFTGPNGVSILEFIALKRGATCAAQPSRGAALRDTEWRLVEIDGTKVRFDDWRHRPTLRLNDEGGFSGRTGCNGFGGTYELTADGLRFKAGAMTMMACPEPQQTMERRYLDALDAVRTAQIASTVLDLNDATGKRRLRFEARSQ